MQIGDDHYGYIYEQTDFSAKGNDEKKMYKCCRGLEKGNGRRLWLFQKGSGKWLAVEAPEDCTDPVAEGKRAFKTATGHDDITIEGQYMWKYYNKKRKGWYPLRDSFEHKRRLVD